MKFDDQLATFLYEKRSLRLEGIGTFTLDAKVSVPSQQDKEIYYPIEGLSFTYNPKADTDEELITFLVKRLHKIQPLVRSDLESYLSNIKQFLNLGKPYTIEGIGTLSKNNQGTYEFTPGNFLPAKEELNPRRENEEHNYPVRSPSSAGRVFVVILITIAALAALGGIGWGVSHLLSKQSSNNTLLPVNDDDTVSPTITSASAGDSGAPNTPNVAPQNGDSVAYKMIFETTRYRARANSRTAQLRRFNSFTKIDTITVNDSLRYRLYLPVKIRPADTTRYKDSLSAFFGNRVFIEKQ